MNRLLALALLVGCTTPEIGTPSLAALGEPVEGAPSWAERLMLVLVNRARADPAVELADCSACAERECYAPAPPVMWSHDLGRAARFHATTLSMWGHGLLHASPCHLRDDIAATFEPDGACDGSPACACEGGALLCTSPTACATCTDCTPFDQRVRLFGAQPYAENIALAGSPLSAMHAFLTEPYDRATCGYGSDSHHRPNGHRYNILSPDRTALGVGVVGSYVAQDFGRAAAPSGLVAGAHHPQLGPAVELYANWYDTVGPTSAQVNIDGVCTSMSLERGTEANGTWHGSRTVGAGCVHYVFEFEGAGGASETMPSTGAYGIGCVADWTSERPARCGCMPSCVASACGDDGCGGSCGACPGDSSCVSGACVVRESDAGGTSIDGSSGFDAGHPEGERHDGAIGLGPDAGLAARRSRPIQPSCSAAPCRSASAATAWLVLAIALAAVRVRRTSRAVSLALLGMACAGGGVSRRAPTAAAGAAAMTPDASQDDAFATTLDTGDGRHHADVRHRRPFDGAHLPFYGATYADVVVEADVAPALTEVVTP